MISHATPVRRDIRYDRQEQTATLAIILHRLDGSTETTTLVLCPGEVELLHAQTGRALAMRDEVTTGFPF